MAGLRVGPAEAKEAKGIVFSFLGLGLNEPFAGAGDGPFDLLAPPLGCKLRQPPCGQCRERNIALILRWSVSRGPPRAVRALPEHKEMYQRARRWIRLL